MKLTEDKFDSKLAHRVDLWSEETKKDTRLKYMVLIKGTFGIIEPSFGRFDGHRLMKREGCWIFKITLIFHVDDNSIYEYGESNAYTIMKGLKMVL